MWVFKTINRYYIIFIQNLVTEIGYPKIRSPVFWRIAMGNKVFFPDFLLFFEFFELFALNPFGVPDMSVSMIDVNVKFIYQCICLWLAYSRVFWTNKSYIKKNASTELIFLINEHNPLPRFFIFGNFTIRGKSSVENAICFRHFQIFIWNIMRFLILL